MLVDYYNILEMQLTYKDSDAANQHCTTIYVRIKRISVNNAK